MLSMAQILLLFDFHLISIYLHLAHREHFYKNDHRHRGVYSRKSDSLVLPKNSRFTENRQKRNVFRLNSGQKPRKEQSKHKIKHRCGLGMPNKPYNDLLFDQIQRFDFSEFLWVQILSYLPLL